jgi:hypothetical protein
MCEILTRVVGEPLDARTAKDTKDGGHYFGAGVAFVSCGIGAPNEMAQVDDLFE